MTSESTGRWSAPAKVAKAMHRISQARVINTGFNFD